MNQQVRPPDGCSQEIVRHLTVSCTMPASPAQAAASVTIPGLLRPQALPRPPRDGMTAGVRQPLHTCFVLYLCDGLIGTQICRRVDCYRHTRLQRLVEHAPVLVQTYHPSRCFVLHGVRTAVMCYPMLVCYSLTGFADSAWMCHSELGMKRPRQVRNCRQ